MQRLGRLGGAWLLEEQCSRSVGGPAWWVRLGMAVANWVLKGGRGLPALLRVHTPEGPLSECQRKQVIASACVPRERNEMSGQPVGELGGWGGHQQVTS